MIISETERFIFIHNPKCGGTSVRNALKNMETTGDFFWKFDDLNGLKIDKAHMPLFVFKRKFPEYFSLLRDYFVFMFVRNPYTRFVSAFNESHSSLYQSMSSGGKADYTAYKDEINLFAQSLNSRVISGFDEKLLRFVRQVDLAYIEKKCFIDAVMKVEEWPHCLKQIEPFSPRVYKTLLRSQKANVRPMKNTYTDVLSEESIKKLRDLYRDDFDVFGYPVR